MRKFQEGGVYDVQPLVPSVSPIPNLPNVEYPEMSAVDLNSLLSLQVDQETRIKRQQDRLLQEQNQIDKAQSVYYTLKDDLFGDYHSEYQGEVISGAKKKYNVTEDLVNSDNLFTLKDQTQNLYKATTDPEVLKVFGEVEYANKIREGLPTQMTPEQKDAFANEWQNYLNFRPARPGERYDMTKLALAATNVTAPKKATNAANFFPATQRVASQLANVDLADPAQQTVALNAIRNAWFIQDPEDAKAQGLITSDPTTGAPVMTPLGEQVALGQLEAATLGASTKQAAQIELDAAKKTNTKEINPPKAKSESTTKTPEEKKADAVTEGWKVILSIAERDGSYDIIKNINPEQFDWLKAKLIALMAADGGASLTASKFRTEWLRELRKIATADPNAVIDPANTFQTEGQDNTVPRVGVTVAPPAKNAPSKGAFGEQMGTGKN